MFYINSATGNKKMYKFCTAKKISTQHCYNNRFEVLSTHKTFDLAKKKASSNESVSQIEDSIKIGDSIDRYGARWVA
jgi:hypothetical protein